MSLREVDLRDGLELVRTFPSTAAKQRWIREKHAAGVRHFEVGLFLPASTFPQFADVREMARTMAALPGAHGIALALHERGVNEALDVTPDRAALARYGIMIQDVQDVIATALGGQTVTTTVQGRQRFCVNMRYPRDLRSNPQAIASDVLVPLPNGGAVPLGEVAKWSSASSRSPALRPKPAW